MRNFLVLFLALVLLTSCQTSNLAVDYEKEYSFSDVKTYSFSTNNTIQLNQIDSTNFMKNLETELQAKGLIKNTNNPDVLITLEVSGREDVQTRNVIGLGIGGGSGVGFGTGIGIPIRKKVIDYSIQVDFKDANTGTSVWIGKISNTQSYKATGEAKDAFFKSNIQSLFKKYPPK
ncbi:MAG: DUF4136 domain-containing protein [Flavobacteriaceae bacterium]|jgi:hypothetical protein|nr:DUF4136 domain-containing protein [Flavobacteriaceae bacterium]